LFHETNNALANGCQCLVCHSSTGDAAAAAAAGRLTDKITSKSSELGPALHDTPLFVVAAAAADDDVVK